METTMGKHRDWDKDNDSGDDGEGRHRKTEQCWKCRGDGVIPVSNDGEKGGIADDFARCDQCKGTGELTL
jgi:hypothetical protein